jgi:hypothetical protein
MSPAQRRIFVKIPLTFVIGIINYEFLALIFSFIYGLQTRIEIIPMVFFPLYFMLFLFLGVVLNVPVCIVMLFSEVDMEAYLIITFFGALILGSLGQLCGGEFLIMPTVAIGHIISIMICFSTIFRKGETKKDDNAIGLDTLT